MYFSYFPNHAPPEPSKTDDQSIVNNHEIFGKLYQKVHGIPENITSYDLVNISMVKKDTESKLIWL